MNCENILKLVPKNKFDNSTLQELMNLEETEVQIILPQLFGWIADMNWPIAKDMLKVLAKFPDSLVPLIKNALGETETDDILKYWIILELLPRLPEHTQHLLTNDIERICNNPTRNELAEEIYEQAQHYLKRFK